MRLGKRLPDGATLRDHLRAAKAWDELEPRPTPQGFDALLEAFWRLRRNAGSSGFGPAAITYEAIAAWQKMNGAALTPWEVETIIELDEAALQAIRG